MSNMQYLNSATESSLISTWDCHMYWLSDEFITSYSFFLLRTWSNLVLVHGNTFSYMRTLKGTYLMMT